MKKCVNCGYANADWANLCKRCKSVLPREIVLPESTKENSVNDNNANNDGEKSIRSGKRKRSE